MLILLMGKPLLLYYRPVDVQALSLIVCHMAVRGCLFLDADGYTI